MAVQKSRGSRARRGSRRAHSALPNLLTMLSTDPTSGETHRRHHMTKDWYYRGKQIMRTLGKRKKITDSEE